MNKYTNPLEHIINCCEQGILPYKFDILNAKDYLKEINQKLTDCDKNESQFIICAWSRINSRGDIYDLRVCHNEHIDQHTVLPIYCNKEDYKTCVEELKKRLTD